ncbi:MAG: hypothetical protein HY822_21625 [Acidobacteria bacterium]|nr:hypothetical protein [Acidobacteriota bacterium]
MERRHFLSCALPALAAGAAAGAEPMYLLTYDHGGLVLWGIPHFAEKLREAVAWLDRYPGFKIGLDNEAYTYDFLAEHDPKLLAEVRGLLDKYAGRFGIGTCTYGQPLSQFINEESNIRQIGYALETGRRHFGRAPSIYLMSEHAMHSQIPQIVAGFGFGGAIMRTHFMMYGYNPTFDLPIGWWVGVDGARVAAIPTYQGQGAEFGRTTLDNWILTRCPGPECKGSLEEFRGKFSHISPLLATRADDSGLRREDLVRLTEGKSEYRWVLLEDLPKIFPAPSAEMKTAPGDFTVRMPWGYCGNEIWNRSRKAETAALTAERMAAAELMTGGASREAELGQAWKNLLVGQHHDIQICGLLPEARKFLGSSLAASEKVADASLRYVASRLAGGGPAQVTVFNPHSWEQRQWVEATFALPRRWAKAIEVRRNGKPVSSVLLSALRASDESIQEARIALLADAPPLGFAAYSLAPVEPSSPPAGVEFDASTLRLANSYWDLRLDPRGGIAALASRRTGAALLDAKRRSGFFAGRIEGREAESAGKWRAMTPPPGARWLDLREEGEIAGIPCRLELRMWADSPRLDFRASFEFENQRIGVLSENKRDSRSAFLHEEKLRFKLFPALASGAVGVRDLPFVVAETPNRYVEGNYWAAVADGRAGLAFFNRGTMGSVREADGGYSLPLAWAMFYIWGTRMLSGPFAYEFALFPFEGAWKAAGLHRRALEYNFPCPVVATAPGDGSLGHEFRAVGVRSDGALVSALYSRGGQVHLRMYEHRGQAAQAFLDREVAEVDLAGNAKGAAGRELEFHPWQIRTFVIPARPASSPR